MTPDQLQKLRDERAPLRAQLAELESNDRGVVEATADIVRYCNEAAAERHASITHYCQHGMLDEVFKLHPDPAGRVNVAPLLAALVGPAELASMLGRFVEHLPEIDQKARAAKLARVRAKLAELEEAEELAVLALEAAGLQPIRRADADPAVVLKVRP